MGRTQPRQGKQGPRVIPRVFLLDCGHFVTYRLPYPANGSRVLCTRCDDEAAVRGKLKPNYQEIIGEEISKAQGRKTEP